MLNLRSYGRRVVRENCELVEYEIYILMRGSPGQFITLQSECNTHSSLNIINDSRCGQITAIPLTTL